MTFNTTIENFRLVEGAPFPLYRSGQPAVSDLPFLLGLGITQIIKLNEDNEGSDDWWSPRTLFKVQIPWTEQVITEPDLTYLGDAVGFIGPNTLVHCTHGQDRTGLVIALWRLTQGWTIEDTEKEWRDGGGDNPLLPGLEKAWADLAPRYVHQA